MIQGFNDYNTTRATGDYEKLELGGHICKILEVRVENLKTKDGKDFQQLILKIDMADNDKQAGYYNRRFQTDARLDALNAKWKGYYKLTIPTNNSEDFVKSNWKTLMTSIEKSNEGVKIDGTKGFDENILVGKVFGGVFGIEEFVNAEGKVVYFSRCRFIRSTEKIDEIGIPKVRLADKTLMDYEEYMEKKKAEREGQSSNTATTETSQFEGDNSDLPF